MRGPFSVIHCWVDKVALSILCSNWISPSSSQETRCIDTKTLLTPATSPASEPASSLPQVIILGCDSAGKLSLAHFSRASFTVGVASLYCRASADPLKNAVRCEIKNSANTLRAKCNGEKQFSLRLLNMLTPGIWQQLQRDRHAVLLRI